MPSKPLTPASRRVRAAVTAFDAGSFYLGRATRIEMEVEVGPAGRVESGDALRLHATAVASPIATSPQTRARDAGADLGEQVARDLRRR